MASLDSEVKGMFTDENNLYVKGIDPVNVIGVEKWEGY